MKKLSLMVGASLMLALSACGNVAQPAATTELSAQRVKPPKPPRPPVPTNPTPGGDLMAQCSFDGAVTDCTFTINGVSQTRTYEGTVSIRTANSADGLFFQVIRDGQVIDEIRG